MGKSKMLILCFILFIMLAGCWDKEEINDLAIVLASGIEQTSDNSILLTIQIKTPIPQEATGPKVEVKQGKGETIFDAMEQLQSKIPRKIFWGHNQAIFVSEELAKEGIREHIDFFARFLDTRLRTNMFITNEKVLDIMNVEPILGTSAGEITERIAKFETGLTVDIRKFFVMADREIETAAIPWLELSGDPTISFKINGIAIFKNNQMVGYIDDKMTRGVLWFRNEIDTASVTIKPTQAEKGKISFDLIESASEIIPIYHKGKWTIFLRVRTQDDVAQNETKLNVMSTSVRKQLEKELEESLKNRVQSMLDVVQKELGADILQIGRAIEIKYPKKWKEMRRDWENTFKEIDIKVLANAQIKRPGSSTKPQGIPESEVEN